MVIYLTDILGISGDPPQPNLTSLYPLTYVKRITHTGPTPEAKPIK
jgi:hypothetical protein